MNINITKCYSGEIVNITADSAVCYTGFCSLQQILHILP